MKRIAFIFTGILFLALAFIPLQTHASAPFLNCGGTNLDGTPQPACGLRDFFGLIVTIINFFLFPTPQNNGFAVVPLLGAIMIIMGGIYLMLGGNNPKMLDKGKDILQNVVIGLIVTYAGWIIVNASLTLIGAEKWTGLGTWWQISF